MTSYESHRKYVKANPKRISHLKANRYAREKGATGSHTLKQWEVLKNIFRNKCGVCLETKPLTKDHIIPLSKGGDNYISNIQPLCRNCNSKKHNKITLNENPELIK
jgi:5-methylcytosine-specific restriction endonuclease McrA